MYFWEVPLKISVTKNLLLLMNTDSLAQAVPIFFKCLVIYEKRTSKNYKKPKLKKYIYNVTLWFNKKKNNNFQGFQVFDFALHPKSKTWKSQKVVFYLNFWQYMKLTQN